MKQVLLASTMMAGLILSSSAYADVITDYSATYNQSAFDNTGNASITIPQFDPSLGTLQSAIVTLQAVTGPQLEVFNIGNVAGTGVGSTAVTYTLTGNGVNLFTVTSSGLQSVTVGGSPGDISSSTPTTTFFDVSGALGSLTDPILFTLNESFTISGTNETPEASLAFGGTASSNFAVSIAYDYVPAAAVPEPMSFAMLGSGLIGLVALRRRDRSSKRSFGYACS